MILKSGRAAGNDLRRNASQASYTSQAHVILMGA